MAWTCCDVEHDIVSFATTTQVKTISYSNHTSTTNLHEQPTAIDQRHMTIVSGGESCIEWIDQVAQTHVQTHEAPGKKTSIKINDSQTIAYTTTMDKVFTLTLTPLS